MKNSKKILETIKLLDPDSIEEISKIVNTDINSLERHSKSKTIVGVYFLYKAEKLVYIGQSGDVFNRVNIHRKTKDFDTYSYIEMGIDSAKLYERLLINKYTPELNKDTLTEKIKRR